jgi:hypothetical protein
MVRPIWRWRRDNIFFEPYRSMDSGQIAVELTVIAAREPKQS